MGWGKIYEADLGLTHITNSDQNMILCVCVGGGFCESFLADRGL